MEPSYHKSQPFLFILKLWKENTIENPIYCVLAHIVFLVYNKKKMTNASSLGLFFCMTFSEMGLLFSLRKEIYFPASCTYVRLITVVFLEARKQSKKKEEIQKKGVFFFFRVWIIHEIWMHCRKWDQSFVLFFGSAAKISLYRGCNI